MKKVRLTERDLTKIVKRIVNEDISEFDSLYSDISSLIDDSGMEPSDVVDVLRTILDNYEAMSYRKKRKIGNITRDDVTGRF
jgi:hypothetical protein